MTLARGIAKGIGAGVASAVTRGQASAGASALDIRASVGTSTSPTSTGTRAVTGVGFTPKVVLPWGSFLASAGSSTTGVLHLGAGTSSSSRAAISAYSLESVTTSATTRRHTASGIVTLADSASAIFGAADLSAMDADGFTLNWSTVAASARILNHICLGGADLEVSLTQQQMNSTNLAQSFAHGLSGAPTGVLFFNVGHTTIPPSTTTDAYMNIGAWAGSNQFGARVSTFNGLTTTSTQRALITTGVSSNGSTTINRVMAVSSVDATNVNVTYPVTGSAPQVYFFMLAIRGAKCQVGTFDCNGSLSPLTINTPGITPKLFLPVFVPDGVASTGTVHGGLVMTIGASDGTNNVSCGIIDLNGATTTAASRFQSSNSLVEYWGGTKQFEATAGFVGQSVVITPSIATGFAQFSEGAYLVIGS